MLIDTTRFGEVEIDGSRIITFSDGLLGFPNHQRFALIQTSNDPMFFWMQSVEDAALAFVVCDPRSVVGDYTAQIRADDVRSLDLDGLEDSQVLVIVNKADGHLTANLLGPLVIGARSFKGKQLVLADKRYTTRHKIVSMETVTAVSKTA